MIERIEVIDRTVMVHSFFINMFIHFNSALEQEKTLPELIDHIHGWEENVMGFIVSPGGKE